MKVKKEDKVINIQSGLIFFIAGFREGICLRGSEGVLGIEEKFSLFWKVFRNEQFQEYFPIGEPNILRRSLDERDVPTGDKKFLKTMKRHYEEALTLLERMENEK